MSLTLGSNGPLVAAWQRVMVARFKAYALAAGGGPLKADGYYGYDDAAVQREYQRRTGQDQTGVVSDADLIALGITKPRPILLTACGTGVPWWVGPDADVARAVEDIYRWRPIGYRAAAFPMNPSVQEGRTEGCRILEEERAQIERHGLVLGGFSQGAIVICEMWEYDIKPEGGRLHWAMPHVRKAFAFGNPMREEGKAWPDYSGTPMASPKSRGIADQLMVDTPPWFRSYAHAGDLYTDCQGESGEMKTAIYKVVMGTRVFSGPDSLLAQVIELLAPSPGRLFEVVALFKAIMDAGMFFAKRTGPHLNYRVQPAIDYLRAGG